jgi:methyl-accepting chemotaxis protein
MALSIKTKIWLPAIAVSIGLVLMSAGSALRTVSSQAATVKEQSDQQSKLEMASRWRGLAEAQALRSIGMALAADEKAAALLESGQKEAQQELDKLQSSLEALLTGGNERAAMDAAKTRAVALQASLGRALSLKSSGDTAQLQSHIQQDSQQQLKAFMSAQQDLVRLTEQGATELRDKAGNERLKTVWGVAGIMGLIILLVCAGTRALQRNVTEPLDTIVRLVKAIGEGDLTLRIATEREDEMGEVLRALSHMSDSLAQLVGQVQHSAGSIGAASVEIAHGNQDLSNRTEATASNLQRASSTMDHLSHAVLQSADSAREANALASSAYAVAQNGGESVSQVVQTMHRIDSSSKKIVDIIAVIDGIAFQTNILALNAAVEAARAGEQGRGFAVVASEVRSLAGRSAEAAREVKELITTSVRNVETGTALVDKAGQTMQEIVQSVQRVSGIVEEITATFSEQSQDMQQVSTTVGELEQMTQQNAALVEQSAAAAGAMSDQAGVLERLVGRFKLADGGFATPLLAR